MGRWQVGTDSAARARLGWSPLLAGPAARRGSTDRVEIDSRCRSQLLGPAWMAYPALKAERPRSELIRENRI